MQQIRKTTHTPVPPLRQLDETRSRLVFRGSFQKDLRVGLAEVYDDYGGCSWVMALGEWDKDGIRMAFNYSMLNGIYNQLDLGFIILVWINTYLYHF